MIIDHSNIFQLSGFSVSVVISAVHKSCVVVRVVESSLFFKKNEESNYFESCDSWSRER